MFSRFVRAAFLAISIIFFSATAFAGKMELTTYYPAPLGEYETLSTTGDTNLATTSGNVGIGTETPTSHLQVMSRWCDTGDCTFLLRATNPAGSPSRLLKNPHPGW